MSIKKVLSLVFLASIGFGIPKTTLAATLHIIDNSTGGDCITIGNWSNTTKTCSVTTNLNDGIRIDSDGVTLDGANYSITGNSDINSSGIMIPSSRTGVVIKDLVIRDFGVGINSHGSHTKLLNNTVANSEEGISVYDGTNNEINNNKIWGGEIGNTSLFPVSNIKGFSGISIFSGSNSILNNYIAVQKSRAVIINTDNNTISGNTIEVSGLNGILFNGHTGNVASNNRILDVSAPIEFVESNTNSIYGNEINGGTIEFQRYSNALPSNTNSFYNNNLIDVGFSHYNSTNSLYQALPVGGNYWSNFSSASGRCGDLNNNYVCDGIYQVGDASDVFPWIAYKVWLGFPFSQNLNQLKSDLTTSISEGEIITQHTVSFSAMLIDPDGDQAKLEIELKQSNEVFNGLDTSISPLVNSGSNATVTISNLSNGDYHWRARVIDSNANQSEWQEFGIPDNTDFTVHLNTPVIIIPGIIGTYLHKDYGDHSEIWPNINVMRDSEEDNFLTDLSPLPSGLTNSNYPISLGDIIKKIDVRYFFNSLTHTTDTFDSLISSLQPDYTLGVDLLVFPYDWRIDNKTNSDLLQNKVDELLGYGYSKVDIVAHSMGGLVAKEYIKNYGSDNVDKLIFVGTPHDGAPNAFKTLLFGDNLKIPFLNSDTVKLITQNMPSVYQLLPSQRYVDTNGNKYVNDLTVTYVSNPGSSPEKLNYSQTKSFMASRGSNSAMFPLAEDLHNDTDNMTLSGVETYNFIGCGVSTVGQITINKKQSKTSSGTAVKEDYSLTYIGGDGTVPQISSSDQTAEHSYYVDKVDHSNLPSTNGVRQNIRQILLDEALDSFNNISSNSSVCSKVKGETVSSHSPVELHIYDSEGRHTGPVESGDIEYGIPEVTYDTIGTDKFAFLPDNGDTYTVINKATDTGKFDFVIQKVDDETITNTISFDDVPLTTLNTNSSIDITGFSQSNFTLGVDQNGDETFESSLNPSAILNESESNDTIRPVSSISLSGTAGDNDWYKSDVTITLTATDDNSGTLKTEYSLDGGTNWINYSVPFSMTNEGTNTIQYFSTDKMGNIEFPKSQTIKIDKTTPVTTISISGTAGTNGWYKSSYVDVTFEATDNLSGMSLIEYSLDDGATWTTYSSLFQIDDNPAINTLKYRSKDNAGNLESIHTQIIKIDRMPPRALMYFDPQTRFLKIVGLEDVSYATVTKINDENYVVKDEAGNALEINIDPTYVGPKTTTLNGKVVNGVSSLNIRVISMFNGSYIVTPEENLVFHYEWNTTTVNGVPKFTLFNQTMDLPDRKLIANYNYLKNTTTISTRFDTDITDPGIPQTETLNGLRIIKLTTPQGSWDFDVEY